MRTAVPRSTRLVALSAKQPSVLKPVTVALVGRAGAGFVGLEVGLGVVVGTVLVLGGVVEVGLGLVVVGAVVVLGGSAAVDVAVFLPAL